MQKIKEAFSNMVKPTAGLSKTWTIVFFVVYTVTSLLLALCGISALAFYNKGGEGLHYHFITMIKFNLKTSFHPHSAVIYTYFSVMVILSFLFCATFFMRGNLLKEETYYSTLFSGTTRYFPIIMFILSCLLLIGPCAGWSRIDIGALVVSFLFSVFICVFSIIIYLRTTFPVEANEKIYDKIKVFIFKKVYLSGIIVFTFFYFWYVVSQMVEWKHGYGYWSNYYTDTKKTISILFQIIFGVVVGLATFVFLDLVGAFFAILIFIGVLTNCLAIDSSERFIGDAIIAAIAIVAILAEGIYLGITRKKEVLA